MLYFVIFCFRNVLTKFIDESLNSIQVTLREFIQKTSTKCGLNARADLEYLILSYLDFTVFFNVTEQGVNRFAIIFKFGSKFWQLPWIFEKSCTYQFSN